jgi:hypothetical protein
LAGVTLKNGDYRVREEVIHALTKVIKIPFKPRLIEILQKVSNPPSASTTSQAFKIYSLKKLCFYFLWQQGKEKLETKDGKIIPFGLHLTCFSRILSWNLR